MAVKLSRSRLTQACPVCGTDGHVCGSPNEYTGKGENAIVMPVRFPGYAEGTSRSSGVVAPERIYENDRLLYAKGAPVKPEDVERLGLGEERLIPLAPAPEEPKTAKPRTRKPKAPAAERKTVARGARRKATAKPEGEDA